MRQRLAWPVLRTRVGDQRGERVAVVGMTCEHPLERLDRLLRPARPVERYRVHVAGALGVQACGRLQLRNGPGHALLPHETERMMRRCAPGTSSAGIPS